MEKTNRLWQIERSNILFAGVRWQPRLVETNLKIDSRVFANWQNVPAKANDLNRLETEVALKGTDRRLVEKNFKSTGEQGYNSAMSTGMHTTAGPFPITFMGGLEGPTTDMNSSAHPK